MKKFIGLVCLIILILAVSCSDTGAPLDPESSALREPATSHFNWGLWQFVADPATESLDVIRLRNGNMHLNVVPFLEPPPLVNITLESVQFNGNLVDVDIGLRHPFAGTTEFTGFDVAGILITNGSITDFVDTDLRMAGAGDTRLLNPDGYARWWNPMEFPHDVGFSGYVDGLLGVKDSDAHFNSTLNAYKFFCDDISDPDGSIDELDYASRCMFTPGKKNVRNYQIELGGDGLVFNYAVDASWAFPTGGPPYTAPDDFGPAANRPETWNILVSEESNTLWNDGSGNGGGITLDITVWDHFDANLNSVYLESPGNFTQAGPFTAIGSDDYSASFLAEVTDAIPAPDSIDILIRAECGIDDPNGHPMALYAIYTAIVDDVEPTSGPKNIALREGFDAMDIAVDHADGDLLVLYSDGAVWKYTEAGNYQDGVQHYLTYEPGMQYIDIAPNSVSIVGGYWLNLADKMNVYAADGTLISNVNIDSGACWARDVTGFTGHTYTNMAGLLSSTCPGGTYTRWRFYPPPGYQTGYWYANLYNYCTATSIDRDTTVGTEAGNISMWYVYYLEGSVSGCEEYRVQRLYRASDTTITNDTGWGPSAQGYWGGTQSDGMIGFWNPKDITRDVNNDFYILDQLSTGDPAIKKYTDEGAPIGTAFGDSTSIAGAPLRIEGSDYVGSGGNSIFVLSDGSTADLLSIFYLSETPSE
jgi:hypothetical protein